MLQRLIRPLLLAALICGPMSGVRAEDGSNSKTNASDSSASNPAVASTNSMDVLDDQRKLMKGDRVSYRVVQERKDPCSLTVTDSGELEVPLIGRVQAAGLTCRALARNIKKALDKDYFYNATVIIGLDFETSKSSGVVYVMGQVQTQGVQQIPPSDSNFTVSKALLQAGGFSDFANKKKVKLIRKKGDSNETIMINANELLDGKGGNDPVLHEGDIIMVPEKIVNF